MKKEKGRVFSQTALFCTQMAQVLVTSFKKQKGKIDKMHKEKKENATLEAAPKSILRGRFSRALKQAKTPFLNTRCAKNACFCRPKQAKMRFFVLLFCCVLYLPFSARFSSFFPFCKELWQKSVSRSKRQGISSRLLQALRFLCKRGKIARVYARIMCTKCKQCAKRCAFFI